MRRPIRRCSCRTTADTWLTTKQIVRANGPGQPSQLQRSTRTRKGKPKNTAKEKSSLAFPLSRLTLPHRPDQESPCRLRRQTGSKTVQKNIDTRGAFIHDVSLSSRRRRRRRPSGCSPDTEPRIVTCSKAAPEEPSACSPPHRIEQQRWNAYLVEGNARHFGAGMKRTSFEPIS